MHATEQPQRLGSYPHGSHPDRLLPADPATRQIARRLYEQTQELPIYSLHSHVSASLLSDNARFSNPTELLLQADHYVLRLLHANGVRYSDLGRSERGIEPLDDAAARRTWRLLCENYSAFAGTPVKYWLDCTLSDVFGVNKRPSRENADLIYDMIKSALSLESYRPRALFERFDIKVLATTDDPLDDLSGHAALRDDPTFAGAVVPTFRPDRLLEAGRPGWADLVRRLGEITDIDTGSYPAYIAALENRRAYFKAHGAFSSDHSHIDAGTQPLDPADAAAIYSAALSGTASRAQTTAFRRHMIYEMARMACDDGLVMTLHPGVLRDHDAAGFDSFGSDIGADIPLQIDFTRDLRPLLTSFGNATGFRLIVFTTDETTYSRELAPLAGYYRGLYVGVPWWYLDAPDAFRRFRRAVTETAGFYRTSGFIDDTRAFLSIPTRHDMARRLDAGFLASLVAEHRLAEIEAEEIARDLVTTIPMKAFKL